VLYLLYFFLASATLFLLPSLGADPLGLGSSRTLWLLPLAFLPHALWLLGRRLQLRGRPGALVAVEGLLRFSPVLLQAAALGAFGAFGLLARAWPPGWQPLDPADPEQWSALGFGLLLTPYLLTQVLVIDARARLFGVHRDAGWVARMRGFQLRLFVSSLVPFVLVGALTGLLDALGPWAVRIEEVGLLGALFGLGLALLAVLLLPRLLTWVWKTESLPPGGLRARLEALAQRAGLRFRDLMLWRTGGMMPNALVMGFGGGTRRVLFTDALVEMLGDAELEAVFGHEMGHAKRHHGLLLGAFALGALLGSEVLIGAIGPSIAESTGWDAEWLFPALVIVALVAWGRSFGSFSRGLEMEADLESLATTGDLQAIVNTLLKVSGPQGLKRASWRHPSTAQRVGFLLSAASDARVGDRLRQRLGWMKRTAVVLFVSALAYRGWNAAGDWDRDWIVADLRLGEYGAAGERLAGGAEISEDLSGLVRVAVALGDTSPEPDVLLQRGLRSLQRGDLERCLRLVELAYLRERDDLGPLLLALDALADGELAQAPDLPAAWRAAMEAWARRRAQ